LEVWEVSEVSEGKEKKRKEKKRKEKKRKEKKRKEKKRRTVSIMGRSFHLRNPSHLRNTSFEVLFIQKVLNFKSFRFPEFSV